MTLLSNHTFIICKPHNSSGMIRLCELITLRKTVFPLKSTISILWGKVEEDMLMA